MAADHYIGLMSGTSLDGVDGVLVRFEEPSGQRPQIVAHAHRPYPAELAADLLALNTSGGDELHRAALAGNTVSDRYAEVIDALVSASRLPRSAVVAAGAHGQTVRHRPLAFDGIGYSLQLLNPSALAERCGIDVIADFRSRDLAAGGQGAPLVPAFHRSVFAEADRTVGVLNLGGISNLSVLAADGSTLGFDCGPGNALMDHWCHRHTGAPFDAAGAWAAGGRAIPSLLAVLRSEPYFAQSPPKSTGRDLFNVDWLEAALVAAGGHPAAQDVQATLAELTTSSCADAVRRYAADGVRLWVCGGGAFNAHLMRRLGASLPGVEVRSTGDGGIAPDQVEATAFAWLARAFVRRLPGTIASVTGARGPRVLGAMYPA